MNYLRLALAFLGAAVAYFAASLIMLVIVPGMSITFLTYPGIYLASENGLRFMPGNMIFILICVLVATVLCAKFRPASSGIAHGLSFGAILGILEICSYVLHFFDHVTICPCVPIPLSITYLIQWLIVGATISLIYKPA